MRALEAVRGWVWAERSRAVVVFNVALWLIPVGLVLWVKGHPALGLPLTAAGIVALLAIGQWRPSRCGRRVLWRSPG